MHIIVPYSTFEMSKDFFFALVAHFLFFYYSNKRKPKTTKTFSICVEAFESDFGLLEKVVKDNEYCM